MGNIETSGTLKVQTDWTKFKKFYGKVKKADMPELLKAQKKIEHNRENIIKAIEICDQMLQKFDELEGEENKAFAEKELTPMLVGGITGTGAALGLGLYESLMNLSVSTQSQMLQQLACAGTGVLAGYAFFKIMKEKKALKEKEEAIKCIVNSKESWNKHKSKQDWKNLKVHLYGQLDTNSKLSEKLDGLISAKSTTKTVRAF